MTPTPRPSAAEIVAVAGRVKQVIKTLYGSQEAAGRAWGKDQPRISKQLKPYRNQVDRADLPASWIFAELAAAGVDVTALLTGVPRPAPAAAVPLFETLLPGSPGEFAKQAVGAYPAPPELVDAAELYAVRVDEALVTATLGGTETNRPTPGDVLIVAIDPAVAMPFAATTVGAETPVLKTIPPTPRRSQLLLPPPIVLVEGAPRLSLAHRVTLFDPGEPPGKHTLRLLAQPLEPAAASEADPIGQRLDVVGFAVWRGGPWRPR